MLIFRFSRGVLLAALLTSALALAGCETEEQKKEVLAAKIREKTSIKDQSGDPNFQAFLNRLRRAVSLRDFETLASMMTPNFGWRLDPPGEGDGVFAYWDKNNVWPELAQVLKQPFASNGAYMCAPGEFVAKKEYKGYRAGICIYEGGWRFAYFVNN